MVKLFLADGFEEIEAITPLDILRRAGVKVVTVGVGGRRITGAHGVVVAADFAEGEEPAGKTELVVLPGGMPGAKNLAASSHVRAAIKAALEDGSYIGAICAAPGVVLAGTGALAGRRWTCFPGFENGEGKYTGEDCVADGRLITANGPGAAVKFACALVKAVAPEKTDVCRDFAK